MLHARSEWLRALPQPSLLRVASVPGTGRGAAQGGVTRPASSGGKPLSSHDPTGLHTAAQEETLGGRGPERGLGRREQAPQSRHCARGLAKKRQLKVDSAQRPRLAKPQRGPAPSQHTPTLCIGSAPWRARITQTASAPHPSGPPSPLVPDLARATLPQGGCLALSTKNSASRQGLFSWWPGRARHMGTGATKSQGGCQDPWGSDHLQAHKTLERV